MCAYLQHNFKSLTVAVGLTGAANNFFCIFKFIERQNQEKYQNKRHENEEKSSRRKKNFSKNGVLWRKQ